MSGWNGIFYNGVFSMGFDMDPNTSQIFTQSAGGGTSNTQTPFGYGYSLVLVNSPNAGILFNTNLTTVIVGARLLVTGGLPGSSAVIWSFYDATAGAAQVTLRVFSDGHLQFYLGSGTGTPLGSASASGVIANNTWVYVEASVTINSSAGAVACQVNGSSVITASSLNTQSTANTYVNAFQFVNVSSINGWYWDDWYMLDTTGVSPLNAFLGNVQVRGDKPNNNSVVGGRNAWSPTNPTNVNYTNVGNVPYNAAEYNGDSTVGDYDMFRFPSVSAASVYFVNEWAALTLDSAGSRTVELNAYSTTGGGSTDAPGPPVTPSSGSITYFNQPQTVDPNTGSAWTVVGAGNVELGVKVQT